MNKSLLSTSSKVLITLMFSLGIFAVIYPLISVPNTNTSFAPHTPSPTINTPSSSGSTIITASTSLDSTSTLSYTEVMIETVPSSSAVTTTTNTNKEPKRPPASNAEEPKKVAIKPIATETKPTPPTTTTAKPEPKVVTAKKIEQPAQTLPPVLTTSFKPISWGVYTGATPWAIEDFEDRINTNPDYLAYFVHWGNNEGKIPPWLVDYGYHKDRTLVLFWEASDHTIGGTDQPDYAYRTILNGDWDSYIEDFVQQTKDYGGEIILIPFSELNGNWTPWSGTKNGNTPEQAVAAYRYLYSFFDNVPNVKMGWAVNSHSVPDTPENHITNYYPGDAYVDIVGVDGFNMNWPWQSFSEIFDYPLRTVSQYGKPVLVFSFGSAEGPKKAEWLRDALYNQLPRYPYVEGWVYFNQNKERNWLLWSDEDTFEVFEEYINE